MFDKKTIKTPQRPGRKPGSKVKFKGLVADAAMLHVTPSHLWRCLTGERQSNGLVNRYNAIKSNSKS